MAKDSVCLATQELKNLSVQSADNFVTPCKQAASISPDCIVAEYATCAQLLCGSMCMESKFYTMAFFKLENPVHSKEVMECW